MLLRKNRWTLGFLGAVLSLLPLQVLAAGNQQPGTIGPGGTCDCSGAGISGGFGGENQAGSFGSGDSTTHSDFGSPGIAGSNTSGSSTSNTGNSDTTGNFDSGTSTAPGTGTGGFGGSSIGSGTSPSGGSATGG